MIKNGPEQDQWVKCAQKWKVKSSILSLITVKISMCLYSNDSNNVWRQHLI